MSVTRLQAGSIKATVEISAGEQGDPAPQACALALTVQAADPSSPLRQRVAALVSARVLDDAPAAPRQVQTASIGDACAQEWVISDPLKHAKQHPSYLKSDLLAYTPRR